MAAGETQYPQIPGIVDHCLLGIADAGVQDIHQRLRDDGLLHGERRPFGIVDHPNNGSDGGGDGEVGLRALLHVDHADFDGLAVEARDGAASVEPFVAQHAVRVEGCDIPVHRRQDLLPRTRLGW